MQKGRHGDDQEAQSVRWCCVTGNRRDNRDMGAGNKSDTRSLGGGQKFIKKMEGDTREMRRGRQGDVEAAHSV